MKYVEPIRDKEVIADIRKKLILENKIRDLIFFELGINTGLRISDIRLFRVRDLKRELLYLTEVKTNKQKTFEMNPTLRRELLALVRDKDDDEFLLKSREGVNKPLSRSMTYKILRKITTGYKLGPVGNHSLRKTYGYHYYKETKDIAMLQKIFNHSSPSITLRYIGIAQDTINLATKRFRI